MQNITELRNELSDNFNMLKKGELETKVVSELNNTAGKIIATVVVELKYQTLLGTKKEIDFLK